MYTTVKSIVYLSIISSFEQGVLMNKPSINQNKKRFTHKMYQILLPLFVLALSACSGSSPTALTGNFEDSAVSGLTYTTATQSGTTDSAGAFSYIEGETITFTLGDTTIGETVAAKSKMTPFDLVSNAVVFTKQSDFNFKFSPEAVAYNTVTNILVFLQSLDEDANLDNGIAINTDVAGMFAGVQIDFNHQDAFRFSRQTELYSIVKTAHTNGFLASGVVRSNRYSLGHYYSVSGQNVSNDFAALATQSHDNNGDGTANNITTYTYDANGNQLTNSYDNNGDGTANSIDTYTYDANGNRLMWSSDTNGDGVPNNIYNYTYDANGNQLTFSYDNNADGIANSITTYIYDANGNQLTFSYDNNADDIANQINTYTYDANNYLLTISIDSDADGTANSIYTYTRDANGNRLTRSYDNNADGTANSIYTYTYDANGNQLTYSYDNNADGTANSIYTYTYDAKGNRLTYSKDSGADGNTNSITTYTYDAKGNRLRASADSNVDGIANEINTYTYDANGNQLTYSYDSNGDGTANRIDTYTYVPTFL